MNKLHIALPIGLLVCAGSAFAAEHKGQRHSILDALDTNGDEAISLIEFQSRDNNLIERMDTDGNGVLTIDEFLNARPDQDDRPNRGERPDGGRPAPSEEQVAQMQERMSARATERFQAMDSNGDEIVTLEEFQAANFAELDRNDDSVLTAEELRPQRRGRQGPGGRGPRGDRAPGN